MSDTWVPTNHEDPDDIAETMTPRKLSTLWGGTGVSATDVNDLKDQLGIGTPPADATGATDVAAGTAGLVPEPPAGSQRQALRGDMTHSTELEVTKITDAAGTALFDVYGLGDKGCRSFIAAANASGNKCRVGAGGLPSHVDFSIEPKGYGRPDHKGDPLAQTIKPTRRLQAKPYGTDFDVTGLTAPTISTPGAAATTYQDAEGSWVRLYQDASASRAPAMIDFGFCSQRRWDPEVIVSFFGLLPSSRVWIGLFTNSPQGFNHLDDADVKTPISAKMTISSGTVIPVGGGFIDSANGFVAAGIRAGDVLTASGFFDSSLNITYNIVSVSPSEIITEPVPAVDEAAGASVTFTNAKLVFTATGVYSITETLTPTAYHIDRSSGDFAADGWAVNDYVAASGFATSAVNAVHRVTAVTTTRLSIATTIGMAAESTPAGAVTLRRVIKGAGFRATYRVDGTTWHFITSSGADQTDTDTGVTIVGTSENKLRFRHVGSGSWECAVWSGSSWVWSASQSNGPAASDGLKLIVLCEPLQDTTDRHMTVKTIDLFQD